MGKAIDISGQRFGRLTALRFDYKDKWRSHRWLCRCDCGVEKVIRKRSLIIGCSQSCGCLQRELAAEKGRNSRTHGMEGTKFYQIYHGAKNRCQNPTAGSYMYYGERGIKFLFESFEEFRDELYGSYLEHCQRYGRKNTSIDRINSNGNYCKENVRWATWKVQRNNRRGV